MVVMCDASGITEYDGRGLEMCNKYKKWSEGQHGC